MKKIAIVGASGLGKEVWNIINDINSVQQTWEVSGFYDDGFEQNENITNNIYCLGTLEKLIAETQSEISIVFAISNRKIVASMVERMQENPFFKFPNIIHPNVLITSGFVSGEGNVIAPSSTISCDVSIGSFNLLNGYVVIGHDAILGNYNSLMPRTQISGQVIIGDFNFFGMNSAVVQGKTIENNNEILAYTLLTKSIKNERKYFGIPGKRISV